MLQKAIARHFVMVIRIARLINDGGINGKAPSGDTESLHGL